MPVPVRTVAQPLESSVQDLDASAIVPGRDPAQLSAFESEVIAIFVDMMQTLGMPKSYGEIYGLLYATPQPLGFGQIHEKLSLSKGSVSGGIKALREIGAIRAKNRSEDRRESFEPELELRKLLLSYLNGRIQPQIDSNLARIERLDGLVKELPSPSRRKILEQRLSKLAKWRKRAAGLIPWISRFLD